MNMYLGKPHHFDWLPALKMKPTMSRESMKLFLGIDWTLRTTNEDPNNYILQWQHASSTKWKQNLNLWSLFMHQWPCQEELHVDKEPTWQQEPSIISSFHLIINLRPIAKLFLRITKCSYLLFLYDQSYNLSHWVLLVSGQNFLHYAHHPMTRLICVLTWRFPCCISSSFLFLWISYLISSLGHSPDQLFSGFGEPMTPPFPLPLL